MRDTAATAEAGRWGLCRVKQGGEEGTGKGSSFKAEREASRKADAGKRASWNTLYMRPDTVVQAAAALLGTTAAALLDPDSEGTALPFNEPPSLVSPRLLRRSVKGAIVLMQRIVPRLICVELAGAIVASSQHRSFGGASSRALRQDRIL